MFTHTHTRTWTLFLIVTSGKFSTMLGFYSSSNFLFYCSTRSDVLRRLTITSVLLVFGVLGNTSIILVLRRLKSATSILTIYMAVFDTLSLMSKVLTDVLDYHNTDNFGYLYCVTMTIPIVVFVALANWTLVVICIERFLSIFFTFSL